MGNRAIFSLIYGCGSADVALFQISAFKWEGLRRSRSTGMEITPTVSAKGANTAPHRNPKCDGRVQPGDRLDRTAGVDSFLAYMDVFWC
jgi:hypothetical protein